MHLQQTKRKSIASGGPQYYFHDVPEAIKDYLRKKGACPVVLQTPYGIAESPFTAVSKDKKLAAKGKVVSGKVGHDRIQAHSRCSIGEAIREWYRLPAGNFERIDIEVTIHTEGHFVLTPSKAKLTGRKRAIEIPRPNMPLSIHRRHTSNLWQDQLRHVHRLDRDAVGWAADQIERVVNDHCCSGIKHLLEPDILRACGGLAVLGMHLGPYLGKSYDCDPSDFSFLKYRAYTCPVEVKKKSSGFKYQMLRYKPLPRAVVLCVEHNLVNPPAHIDVVELPHLLSVVRAL